MSLFRCCFGKSKKKDPDVKTSTIKKNLTLCGEIDWNVLNFDPRDKIWTNETSRDFIFFFPEADKFFKFALELKPIHDCRRQPYSDAHLYFINRNSEDLEILTESRGCYPANRAIKAQSKELMRHTDRFDIIKELTKGDLHLHIDFSFSYPIFENVDPKLHAAERSLFRDAAFADFAIECGTEKFPCHKAILANRSDFFARLFSSQEWIEVRRKVFQIKGHDPAVVKQMLEFIYANQIPDGTGGSLQLLLIAKEFCLKDLVKFCEAKIAKTLSCDNALKILRVADEVPKASQLREYVIQFVAKNISSFMDTEDWKDVVEPKPDLLQAIKKIAFQP